MVSTLKHIYNENGIVRGLYRGMSINYLRAIPMVAVSFSTYEVLKQALNLDTGMKIWNAFPFYVYGMWQAGRVE